MLRLLTNWRVLAAVVAIGALLAAALWPEAVEVDVVRATRKSMQVTIDEEGVTRIRERFVVSAPVAGRLQRIVLEPGNRVSRGQTVLARLTPAAPALVDARTQAELSAAVEAARAALGQVQAERARSEAALQRARSSFQRQETLLKAGAISRDEVEAAQTALRAAEEAYKAADFSVARSEHDLQMARARLQQPGAGGRAIEIVAPIDGVVLKRMRESEAVVPAGEPLLEIGDLAQIEVVADLLSTDAVRVAPGNKVLIEQWGGGHTLEGRVRLVEPSGFTKISALGVEEQRVNVVIDFADPVAAAKELGDAYRVEARIVVWEQGDVLTVPVGSLFRRGDDWAVFVVEDNAVRTQVVTLGQRNATDGQVLEGLDEGDRIVIHPPDTLRDGLRVAERST
jgi:HlyD family secretion protein